MSFWFGIKWFMVWLMAISVQFWSVVSTFSVIFFTILDAWLKMLSVPIIRNTVDLNLIVLVAGSPACDAFLTICPVFPSGFCLLPNKTAFNWYYYCDLWCTIVVSYRRDPSSTWNYNSNIDYYVSFCVTHHHYWPSKPCIVVFIVMTYGLNWAWGASGFSGCKSLGPVVAAEQHKSMDNSFHQNWRCLAVAVFIRVL